MCHRNISIPQWNLETDHFGTAAHPWPYLSTTAATVIILITKSVSLWLKQRWIVQIPFQTRTCHRATESAVSNLQLSAPSVQSWLTQGCALPGEPTSGLCELFIVCDINNADLKILEVSFGKHKYTFLLQFLLRVKLLGHSVCIFESGYTNLYS